MKRPSAVLQNRAHWLKSSTCGSAEFDVLRGQTHVDKGQTGWSTTRKTLPNKFSNFEGDVLRDREPVNDIIGRDMSIPKKPIC